MQRLVANLPGFPYLALLAASMFGCSDPADESVPQQIGSAQQPTVLTIVAGYEARNNGIRVEGVQPPPEIMQIKSFSPQRYVTNDDDFNAATVRSALEEARANAELYRVGTPPKLTEVRGVAARAISRVAAAEAPQQLVVSFAAGASRPPGTPQSLPTE